MAAFLGSSSSISATLSVIDPISMKLKQTITIPNAVELDAITTDPSLDSVYITDEDPGALWLLTGHCDKNNKTACIK